MNDDIFEIKRGVKIPKRGGGRVRKKDKFYKTAMAMEIGDCVFVKTKSEKTKMIYRFRQLKKGFTIRQPSSGGFWIWCEEKKKKVEEDNID